MHSSKLVVRRPRHLFPRPTPRPLAVKPVACLKCILNAPLPIPSEPLLSPSARPVGRLRAPHPPSSPRSNTPLASARLDPFVVRAAPGSNDSDPSPSRSQQEPPAPSNSGDAPERGPVNLRDFEPSEGDKEGIRPALSLLKFYKTTISPLLPPSCRFLPTCSEYAAKSYKQFGLARGTILTGWRLLRCSPLNPAGWSYDPPVLQQFWDLASLEEDARKQAAVSLVQALIGSQQGFVPSADSPKANGTSALPPKKKSKAAEEDEDESGEEVDDDDDEDGGDEEEEEDETSKVLAEALAKCSPVVSYCLKRLIRGLASSRQGARQGFSLALTLALSQLAALRPAPLSPAQALALMEVLLHTKGPMKGGEARDVFLGRTFFLGALARSGLLASDDAAAAQAASLLADLWAKKSFLRESACAVLVELCESLPAPQFARLYQAAPSLRALLQAQGPDLTPEALWLALKVWGKLPEGAAAQIPCLGAAMGRDAQANALQVLGPSRVGGIEAALKASTSATPRLHSVWPPLLALCVKGFSEHKDKAHPSPGCPAALHALWSSLVEAQLFASASHEKKYLGLQLFQLILPHLDAESVPVVLSPNFMRCLQNNVAAKDTYLHAAAKRCLDRLTAVVEGKKEGVDERTRIAVMAVMQQQGPGLPAHPRAPAKEDVLGSIGKNVDGETLAAYAEKTAQQLMATAAAVPSTTPENGDEEGAASTASASNAQLKKALDHLFSLLRLPQFPPARKEALVHTLAVGALLSAPGAPASAKKAASKKAAPSVPAESLAFASAELPATSRKALAGRVLALLGEMTAREAHLPRDKGGKGGAAEAGPVRDHLREVAAMCASLIASKAAKPREEGEGEEGGVGDRVAALGSLLQSLSTESPALSPSQRSAIAHQAACLLLFSLADPACLDASAVEDFCTAVTKLQGGGSGGAEEEHDPMDVVLDVQLSLLSASYGPLPAGVLRGAVESLVKQLASRITPRGIEDMVEVLRTPLRKGGEGEEEEDGMEVDGDDDSALEDESEDSDEEDSDEEEDGDNEDEDEEEEEAAVKPSSAKKARKEESEGEESEEELMDDEQMFKMDGHITAYLSSLKQQKASAKQALSALVAHKLRVVSLLEALARKAPESPHLPALVLPLLDALKACPPDQPVLQSKLAALLADHVAKGKAKVPGLDVAQLTAALEATWRLAARTKATEVLAGASQSALVYLLRLALSNGEDARRAGQALLDRVVKEFFASKRCRLPARFFDELFLRLPEAGVSLLLPLAQAAVSARSEPLQLRALYLASLAVQYARAEDASLQRALGDAKVLEALGAALLRGTRAPGSSSEGAYSAVNRQADALASGVRVLELLRKKKALGEAGEKALVGRLSGPLKAALEGATASEGSSSGVGMRVMRALHRLGALLGVKDLPALPKKEKREGGAGPSGQEKKKKDEGKDGGETKKAQQKKEVSNGAPHKKKEKGSSTGPQENATPASGKKRKAEDVAATPAPAGAKSAKKEKGNATTPSAAAKGGPTSTVTPPAASSAGKKVKTGGAARAGDSIKKGPPSDSTKR